MHLVTQLLKNIILPMAIVLLSAGCHAPERYHAFRTLPVEGWTRGDTLCFALPRQTHTMSCRATIEIRHTGRYPYRSLWLLVSHNTTDSLQFRTDTIECALTDAHAHFDGTGINDLYQKSFPLSPMTLKAGTSPIIRVVPFMKDRFLPGITDIGVRLTPVQ